jgi:hypothetical protein
VQSSGATERLRLWDKFCTSTIDPEAVKINFLRHSRISQYYPRKRIPRVKLNPKNTAKVITKRTSGKCMLKIYPFQIPEAVRNHYKEPKSLVPPGFPIDTMEFPSNMIPKESSEEDQELVLKIF